MLHRKKSHILFIRVEYSVSNHVKMT